MKITLTLEFLKNGVLTFSVDAAKIIKVSSEVKLALWSFRR